MRDFIFKIGLFLSAFVPLYILILLKIIIEPMTKGHTYSTLNLIMMVVFVLFSICGIVAIVVLQKRQPDQKKEVEVVASYNLTDQHFFQYFSLFVLFAVTFDLSELSMFVVFLLTQVLMGVVYIRNNVYYINPLLNFLGYSYVELTYREIGSWDLKKVKLYSKLTPLQSEVYTIKNISKNLIFLK